VAQAAGEHLIDASARLRLQVQSAEHREA
jgi:hypothetical protein